MPKNDILKMDLQLFADNPLLEDDYIDESEGNQEVAGVEGDGPINPEDSTMPDNLPDAVPQVDAVSQPTAMADGDIKSYLEERFNSLQDNLLKGQQADPALDVQPGEIGMEDDGSQEDLEAEFYKDPVGMINKIAERIANEKYQPIIQEMEQNKMASEMDNQFKQFSMENPDVFDYLDPMAKFIQENPYLQDKPEALGMAYKMAKYDKLTNPESGLKNVDDVMNDEQVKSKIIKEYLSGIQKKNESVPPTINKVGGNIAQAPMEKPNNLKEASKMFLNSLDN